jgi:hypothetical protein
MDDAELDRALKATLSVSPSPEFVAKVRTAVAADVSVPSMSRWLVPAVAVALVGVLAIALTNPDPRPAPQTDMRPGRFAGVDIVLPSAAASRPKARPIDPVPVARNPARHAHIRHPARRDERAFEVIFSPSDAEAYRRLFSSVGSMPYELSGEVIAEDNAIAAIDFAPIVIEPQRDFSLDKGVFQ